MVRLPSVVAFFFVFIFLLHFQGIAANTAFATIDSLAGNAEIQRAGQQNWLPATCGAKLSGNDIIRVLEKSFVRLGLPDGSTTFVRANSQIMVNFFDSSEPSIFSIHITVLFGAVFFVVKEILPKAFTKIYDTKAYTPTTVVSVRGTAFSIEVSPKNGATSVKAIHGTVHVQNIATSAASFMSAGFKCTVATPTDSVTALILLDGEVTELKTWVPADVIDKEIAAQLAKAKRDHQVLSDDFKDKIIVLPFSNHSKYEGKWKIGLGFAGQLAEQLRLSNKNASTIAIDSSRTNPLKIGESEKARFVILGDIEDFDVTQHAEITASADEYKEFYIAKVRLHIQLFDVTEKKIVLETNFVGETRGKNVKDNAWQKISTFTFNQKDLRFSKSILGSSVQQVLDQAAEKIVRWSNFE
jgi:hypothetical protein